MAKLGVTHLDDELWAAADQACRRQMPEFFDPYHPNNPTHPYRLFEASECIRHSLWRIEHLYEWAAFRDQMRRMVNRMDGVSTMVCLGLGPYQEPARFENMWIVQYAVFAYMWRVINQKWQNECRQRGDPPTLVRKFFQDPDFDTGTKYLLEKIPRANDPGQNVVVEHPEALNVISADPNTFVFAPHLPSRLSISVLSCRPKVYIGNSQRGAGGWDIAMVEEYMQECRFEGTTTVGQRVNNLWTEIQAARTNYDQSFLLVTVDGVWQFFCNLTIYERRN